MSPPVPVFSREEVIEEIPELGYSKAKLSKKCSLYTITQNQCTFNGTEIICLPFKRTFARCPLINKAKDGRLYADIEITTSRDNNYKKQESMLEKFLSADKELRKKFQDYTETAQD